MIVKIKDKEIELKKTMRAIILYEAIAKKPFNPKTTTDMVFYFYANLLAATKNATEITLDEFIDYLDSNPGILAEFSEWLIKVNEVEAGTVDSTKKKTKRTTKKH